MKEAKRISDDLDMITRVVTRLQKKGYRRESVSIEQDPKSRDFTITYKICAPK